MSGLVGEAGRRALEFAQSRVAAGHHTGVRAPEVLPDGGGALPLLQRAAGDPPPSDAGGGAAPPSTAQEPAPQAAERETSLPSAQEVADRVYRLFCQELRRGRERRGR